MLNTRWSQNGIWQQIFNTLAVGPDTEWLMIDSTIVKVHQHAAGASGKKNQNIGRSRGGLTSKIHTLCDALGKPLKFVITAGQTNDYTQADALLENAKSQYILADKGYDSNQIIETMGAAPWAAGPSIGNRRFPKAVPGHRRW
ncbi:IS5 family transposase [Deltaproteobacteria bacterium OttesenSCG-928-K17]|nr:IS5 family transposase [Deltaproteobacteria bacterium OttesenSCG-928-K17]